MNEIDQLQTEISEKIARLNELRKNVTPTEVTNYTFQTLEGDVKLLDLFAGKSILFAIHNMGQGQGNRASHRRFNYCMAKGLGKPLR